jgi:hypothetical protein
MIQIALEAADGETLGIPPNGGTTVSKCAPNDTNVRWIIDNK